MYWEHMHKSIGKPYFIETMGDKNNKIEVQEKATMCRVHHSDLSVLLSTSPATQWDS